MPYNRLREQTEIHRINQLNSLITGKIDNNPGSKIRTTVSTTALKDINIIGPNKQFYQKQKSLPINE
ncbi:hypothetical protein SAMN04488128_103795 [Chitinophaga eiseniae]|uniref:Uncharacterized protein n=1 Tax=Chitinophaga eiseniae TaxID=634771 RepID=A0A1T4SYD6_9BACT|nr:hypothetical protein SAMN04488128_103795 [Chitinophaga eiseniae]